MLDRVRQFLADESAATAIEYALIASLIAITIIVSLNNLGVKLKSTFNEVAGNLK
jgi:pilus assembly protein Flp/PilA